MLDIFGCLALEIKVFFFLKLIHFPESLVLLLRTRSCQCSRRRSVSWVVCCRATRSRATRCSATRRPRWRTRCCPPSTRPPACPMPSSTLPLRSDYCTDLYNNMYYALDSRYFITSRSNAEWQSTRMINVQSSVLRRFLVDISCKKLSTYTKR